MNLLFHKFKIPITLYTIQKSDQISTVMKRNKICTWLNISSLITDESTLWPQTVQVAVANEPVKWK